MYIFLSHYDRLIPILTPIAPLDNLVHLLLHTSSFFFFIDPAPPEIYTLSLHDALPISPRDLLGGAAQRLRPPHAELPALGDRKSTRLNSSHTVISYAVFCLKKKKLMECQLKQAQFPDPQKTVDNFTFTFNPKQNDNLVL